MYARGMSVRDIQAMLQEQYRIEVSPDFISGVTDAGVFVTAQNCQDILVGLLGGSTAGCSARPTPACFYYQTYCKCAPNTCTTISWNTSPGASGCTTADQSPPGGQCRHQQVCIVGYGATLACVSNCTVTCGGTKLGKTSSFA